ncbi:MAG: transcriptional regulator [Microbacterium sp.]|jgi:GAF domain-containing protein|uniref:GAF and ANTAR domain-containing protein n=1 Tax=Microbacterium sp. TaxID=51671 RepID=UPI00260EBCD4|nr:GAF and ANTAR domain-containing protein [Microbacterium sp.]MDF2563169.1 transcriptional regulator [Microbacterium sp.]
MTETSRDSRIFQTFAMLADTMVDDYDVVDLLQLLVDACHEVLGISAAGILLADDEGDLQVVASTSEASRLVELMQLGAQAGPCIECYRTGAAVSVASIPAVPEKWGAFRDSATAHGFGATDAVPLRLRDTTIGALNLLREEEGPPDDFDVVAARAFADVATIGILHERSLRESELLSRQLQQALQSRIVIEQAKGVVSFTNGVPIDDAFQIIRSYARRNQLPLSSVAARLVNRELRIADPAGDDTPR